MMRNFFIWCAGSDTALLAHCSKREQNKHIGYGTLVLIPAILAFVSMSFALSTLEGLSDSKLLHWGGGLIWGLIIFSFDRFIVSTHRRKMSNREELRNPAFFLRLGFALLLGIIISHPLVMMYFDGSIQDQISENTRQFKAEIAADFEGKIAAIDARIIAWDSLYQKKLKDRDQQALIVAQEIDGAVLANAKGTALTTGLSGKGPAAEEKIKQLKRLQTELEQLKKEEGQVKKGFQEEIARLKSEKETAMNNYAVSKDYLRRELALSQLKEKNSLVGLTEFLLISLFVLVDLLPLLFKTFAPYGLYDRFVSDDADLIKQLNNESRRIHLQGLYESISQQ